ncbi:MULTISPECIES: hypothetical protein [Burkholderia]|uniref:Pilus assembly protein n=1 Tax=Burkholderia semiarida TaxID=2843303 RepID=A0ABW7LAW2_9BURK|nr:MULTISPECIES: hypothetical protein [Burkholderia]MCA8239201.1 hypothetical protein [Burkholderia sp. AU32262]MDF3094716.1 hypothetical protein [Burkholderia semiarida]MDF3104681.1 hypothetical protein [Burkholderia semiarida]WJN74976.1 hypothetical protein OH687_32185 [Burkholderia anthina]
MMLAAFFVVALVALIAPMYRGVMRGADAKLRARFDEEAPRGDAARQLMRDAGYNV